jgi:hypothetical protein
MSLSRARFNLDDVPRERRRRTRPAAAEAASVLLGDRAFLCNTGRGRTNIEPHAAVLARSLICEISLAS